MAKRRRKVAAVTTALIAAALAAAVAAAKGIAAPCLFYNLTGFMCPGCGNTRAAVALLRFDIKGSLSHNFMLLPEVGYIIFVYAECCKNYIRGKGFRYRSRPSALDFAALGAVAVWGIVRNFI